MILRRLTQHIKAQNWLAVLLDFCIVVLGVFVGLQVQEWATENKRMYSERQYLERLHDEVEQLAAAREVYDSTRIEFSETLFETHEVINNLNQELTLTDEQCRIIAHSSFTTVPPADLPSATELISSGRLDQLASPALRNSILAYLQDVSRARDLIDIVKEENIGLSRVYPELLKSRLKKVNDLRESVDLQASCNIDALRNNQSFINDFNNNVYMYVVYTERGVLQVSQKLADLHKELDGSLGIDHSEQERL